jgi:hypothetical protein
MPQWVVDINAVPKSVVGSEITRLDGRGIHESDAESAAKNKIVGNLAAKYGTRCSVANNKSSCARDFTANYRILDSWSGKCSDGFIVHLLVESVDHGKEYDSSISIGQAEREALGLKPLLPGKAQFSKNENFKGLIFLALCAISLAGGGFFLYYSDSYYEMATGTNDLSERSRYLEQHQNYNKLAVTSFTIFGVLYALNLIDGYSL